MDWPADLPVHADRDWGNWLADDQNVNALLDFERALSRVGDTGDPTPSAAWR